MRIIFLPIFAGVGAALDYLINKSECAKNASEETVKTPPVDKAPKKAQNKKIEPKKAGEDEIIKPD